MAFIALLTGVCALMLAAAPTAQAVVVNFDDQPSAMVLDEQYAALGVHFGPSPFPGQSGKLTAVSRPGRARSAPNVAALNYDAGTDFSSSWITSTNSSARSASTSAAPGAPATRRSPTSTLTPTTPPAR